jgi:hypothetical protein
LKHRAFNDEPALFIWVCEAKNRNAEVDYVLQVGPRIVYASVVVELTLAGFAEVGIGPKEAMAWIARERRER